jgi:hypothetical protein
MEQRAYAWFGRRICVGRVILYTRHIEKVLDLSLHRFRYDIAPVCPILRPRRPIHFHCAFHPHCALHCRHVAVMPSTPSCL